MKHWGDFVAEGIDTHGPIVVGVDPVPSHILIAFREGAASEAEVIEAYTLFVLDSLSGHARFVKFQSAFFEAHGSAGVVVLAKCIQYAKKLGYGVILDAKRGDIGSTATAYARAYLIPNGSDLEVDCITINPYLGPDTLKPFLDCCCQFGKGVFILAKTSNPGSGWLQDKIVDGATVSEHVAALVQGEYTRNRGASGLGNVGAVVGATYLEDAQRLWALMPNTILLMPGLGPQGGDAQMVARLRKAETGTILVPVSRGLTFVDDRSISKEKYRSILVERFRNLTEQV